MKVVKMSVREIIVYPDRRLFKKSKKVEKFDEQLHVLLDDMYDTMSSKDGVGLAAIQVGVRLNVLIINPVDEQTKEQSKDDLLEAVNPSILKSSGEQVYQEGCLSVPGYYEDIKRAQNITVKYYDRYGKEHIKDYDGFLAVAWQHEIEHLDGHLFIEKLSIIKRKKFEKELRQKKKNNIPK
jgi:peptide deformylase